MFCSKSVFRCFKALERFGDKVTGAAGPFFVGFAVTLLSTGAICFFEILAPSVPFKLIGLPFCILVVINLFTHYYYVCTIPPGFVDDPPRKAETGLLWARPKKGVTHTSSGVVWSKHLRITEATKSKCKRCLMLRPEVPDALFTNFVLLTIHPGPTTAASANAAYSNSTIIAHVCYSMSRLTAYLSATGINQCVGLHNERHFVLFLVYLVVSTFCFTMLGFSELMIALGLTFRTYWTHYVPSMVYILIYILAIVICFAVSIMGLYHLWGISNGETSVEAQDHEVYRKNAKQRGETFINSYDLGRLENLRLFFNVGADGYPWYTLVLPLRIMPYTDGHAWARHEGCDAHVGVRRGEELTDEEEEFEDEHLLQK